MTIGDRLLAAMPAGFGECTLSESFGKTTVDVPPAAWVPAVTAARDRLGCRFFDWLTAVDEGSEGLAVVCHLWSVEYRYGLLLRTRIPLDAAHLATLTPIFAGAGWHERETYEMFGIVFDGHPNLVPLLLPEGFEGHPLRKEFVLASRVAKEWPGAREPGESSAPGPSRRRMRPPGVPDPADWGPDATPAGPDHDPAPLTDAGTATSPTGSPEPAIPPGTSDPDPPEAALPAAREQDPGRPGAPRATPTLPPELDRSPDSPAGTGPTAPGSPDGEPDGPPAGES